MNEKLYLYITDIRDLVNKHFNDSELGEELRKWYYEKKAMLEKSRTKRK